MKQEKAFVIRLFPVTRRWGHTPFCLRVGIKLSDYFFGWRKVELFGVHVLPPVGRAEALDKKLLIGMWFQFIQLLFFPNLVRRRGRQRNSPFGKSVLKYENMIQVFVPECIRQHNKTYLSRSFSGRRRIDIRPNQLVVFRVNTYSQLVYKNRRFREYDFK